MPNYGPGTDPGVLRSWAHTVEGLGFDHLMISDHLAITPDVAAQYPAPFYEPFTTLSWFAGFTSRVRLGTTVLILPYRHPLHVARSAANLQAFSGGRFVLGVGIGWARQEFDALGIRFDRRGAITDDHLRRLRTAWKNTDDYRCGHIPIWVGGNSDAALRRSVLLGDAWHPYHFTMPWWQDSVERLRVRAAALGHPVPQLAPRIKLRLTETPITTPERLAGEGTIDQVAADLEDLRRSGAAAVTLDTYNGDPTETRRPADAFRFLAAVAAIRPPGVGMES
ncbi:Luciferase-like monooxygenase [Actinoalloteichus hymeniacidonis]|uniref:Luciferase-like monooxygenase n=1 Tax=Actinoalloteichus hymeniacidonis TaxID=340345 RepID=A0AAC9MYY8_9PSEU|nr:Luciferase-like monooxygenase [Actinoalloteichus hymeniacidonis]